MMTYMRLFIRTLYQEVPELPLIIVWVITPLTCEAIRRLCT